MLSLPLPTHDLKCHSVSFITIQITYIIQTQNNHHFFYMIILHKLSLMFSLNYYRVVFYSVWHCDMWGLAYSLFSFLCSFCVYSLMSLQVLWWQEVCFIFLYTFMDSKVVLTGKEKLLIFLQENNFKHVDFCPYIKFIIHMCHGIFCLLRWVLGKFFLY